MTRDGRGADRRHAPSTAIAEPSLRDLAIATGTDKEGGHSYTAAYERHLGRLRGQPITLLEIGVGGYADSAVGGASLRMWKSYFARGKVIGLDIEDKAHFSEDRIVIVRGDQGDPAVLEDLASRFGPFDVVIDDGSHRSDHVITSFQVLFPHVSDGGVYVIEDLQAAYWERYGGSSTPNASGTSMTLLQRLADGLNYAEFDIAGYEPTYTDLWITSIAFYHNIAFIEKGPNLERSNMLPPHPRASRRYARPPARRPVHPFRRFARRVVPQPVRRILRRLAATATRAARGLRVRPPA